ncbi:MAG: multiubiquitin domain-containing protein [Gammaproteobacteria bacterium]|nr:multiubiquitin domain-containing protein [Gammaproteobacteria bacterium]MCY4276897.1 multiubiquitin domain-containing protein [Gammaproteobacteria bacterium]
MQKPIEIDGKRYEIRGGLVRGQTIYDLAGCAEGQLFVNRSDDIDVQLGRENFMIIRGEEIFVSGESSVENNPSLRRPVQIRFNGKAGPALPTAKMTGFDLKQFDEEIPQGRLFVDIGFGPDAEIPDDMTLLVQDDNAFFVIPAHEDAQSGDAVDIEECGRHGRRPPKGLKYKVKIDREKYVVEGAQITGAQILALVGKTPEEWALNQKLKGGKRERVRSDDFIDLSEPGTERFETVRRQAQQGSE